MCISWEINLGKHQKCNILTVWRVYIYQLIWRKNWGKSASQLFGEHINLNRVEEKLRNKSCWSAGSQSFVNSNLHYKDGMIYAQTTGCRVTTFCQLFRQKTEINHAVENLAKIWHHMWHWGHKCNCFRDLSLIVAVFRVSWL